MTRIETIAVHGGRDDLAELGVHAPPIDLSTTYPVPDQALGGEALGEWATGAARASSPVYARLHNPTVARFEQALAKLEHTEAAVAFGSGMAAVTAVIQAACVMAGKPHVVAVRPLYGGTDHLLSSGLLGVSTTYVEAGLVSSAIRPDTGLIVVETPANPNLDLVDIDHAVRQAGSVPVMVDNTFATPILQNPALHGASYVLHSGTKYLGGHSDLTAGAVMGPSDLIAPLRKLRYQIGSTAQPWTAWLLTRSLETLQVRVERQTATATTLAGFLDDHPKVERVSHLSLLEPGDPGYDAYKRQATGPGAMVTFDIDGDEEDCFRFLDALRLIRHAVSLGGTETIVSQPWNASHFNIPAEEKLALGIKPGTVRMSVGLEAQDDLIADLAAALGA